MILIDLNQAVISQRLKAVRKTLRLSQANFGKPLGIGQDAISDYENSRNEPSKRTIDAIIMEYSINKHWFETGEGEMFVNKLPVAGEPSIAYRKYIPGKRAQVYLSQLPEKEAELYIPYYDVEITAGKLELYFDDVDEIPTGYIYAPQYRDCIACNVKGDSMYDRIFPGSRLYVYHLPNRKYIDYGQIYLVVLDGYRLLKYVHPHPEDDTKIRLSSYNKHYSHWDIDRADILNLFIVKGYENQNAM